MDANQDAEASKFEPFPDLRVRSSHLRDARDHRKEVASKPRVQWLSYIERSVLRMEPAMDPTNRPRICRRPFTCRQVLPES